MTDNTQENINFQAATLAAAFQATLEKFDNLLLGTEQSELAAIHKKMHEELNKYRQEGFLTTAFVGQYSAGKSTIISAMTGRRDIHIGADITTDKTTSYDWNGIKLIDTPGLFTERKDHDEITYNTIRQADLLIFCLTYMLFDAITVENFKKLAYELGYRWKMMLVVNKMSDGAGEEAELIANYHHSLAVALEPYKIDDFTICFIDAKDYCEGVDEDDKFMREISRLQTFTDALNTFVDKRGVLARFDTPVRIALGYLDETQVSLMRDSNEDTAFFELMNRYSRILRQERDRLKTKTRSIALQLSAKVTNRGTSLAENLGKLSKEQMEAETKTIESDIQKYCQNSASEIEEVIQIAVESIQGEFKKVSQGDIAKVLRTRLHSNQKASAQDVECDINVERLQQQINWLEDISQLADLLIDLLASGRKAASQGFVSSANVAGSQLHKGVYVVGKFLNFNFAPWQAVNIAKGISNAFKFAGPIIGVISLGMTFHSIEEEEKQAQKLSEARLEISNQFQTIAKDIESQFEAQIREVEFQIWGEIEKHIAEARQEQEAAINSSSQWLGEIIIIRKEFQDILRDINIAGN